MTTGSRETARVQRVLSGFERRFGAPHLAFACHAAVPIALTPELAYEIWTTFRVDERERPLDIPWIAVADLLLSELCAEIGHELYEIRPDVRRALVARLREDERFGEARLGEVATFLLAAAEAGLRPHDSYSASLATSQRWAALAYTAPERAAAMIAEAMRDLSAADPAAWTHMEAVLDALSDPLAEHAPLRSMASAMAAAARGRKAPPPPSVEQASRPVSLPASRARPPESHVERLNVLVASTDDPNVPDGARAVGEALGAALGRAGYRLITNGRRGLDEIVARAFSEAVPAGADYEQRLLHVTPGGKPPVFQGGGWVQVPGTGRDRAAEAQAIALANVVVGVGGPLADVEALSIADQLGKFVVPLLWMGGRIDAYQPALPPGERETPLCHTGRIWRMLRSEAVATLPAERWLMAVIELSDPQKERMFREYNDALADCVFSSYRDLERDGTPLLQTYWSELREAGAGAPARERFFDDAMAALNARAPDVPAWLFHDLARVGEPEDWTKRHEIREALLRAAAKHARPHIADIASAMFRGPTPDAADQPRELLLAARGGFADDGAYLEWLLPIVVAWTPALVAGTGEMSDRGHAMVALLREVAPPPRRDFLRPFLASPLRAQRLAGYLLACAFPGLQGAVDLHPRTTRLFADAFDAALEHEVADADASGTGWALLWLARALGAVIALHDDAAPPASRAARAHAEATLVRLCEVWEEKLRRVTALRVVDAEPAALRRKVRERRPPAAAPAGARNVAGERAVTGERAEETLSWAVEQGRDRHGRWASFSVGEVVQKMRWIAPGRFLMGSPESEPGRAGDEGPRHEVRLSRGFWLADTPCTQALWEAVMGSNPSRFRTPDRPVETVSWDQCQVFLAKLGRMVPGLLARLPTEAEWEYACRGGTTTATWPGDVAIRGAYDAPILDAIAWYGGNSGDGFDLPTGVDSSAWPEKQYPHTLAGTRPVRRKEPNPHGLFDMLGNVHEWCQDWYGPYAAGLAVNPTGPATGSSRCHRGGSWYSRASHLRAASRRASPPGTRVGNLGFRICGGQGPVYGSPA